MVRRLRQTIVIALGDSGRQVSQAMAMATKRFDATAASAQTHIHVRPGGLSLPVEVSDSEHDGGFFRYETPGGDPLLDALHLRFDYLLSLRSRTDEYKTHVLRKERLAISGLRDAAEPLFLEILVIVPTYEIDDADDLHRLCFTPLEDFIRDVQDRIEVYVQPVLLLSWRREARLRSARGLELWCPVEQGTEGQSADHPGLSEDEERSDTITSEDPPAEALARHGPILARLNHPDRMRPPLLFGDFNRFHLSLSRRDFLTNLVPTNLLSITQTDLLEHPGLHPEHNTPMPAGHLNDFSKTRVRAGSGAAMASRLLWWPEEAVAREELRRRISMIADGWFAERPEEFKTRAREADEADLFLGKGERHTFPREVGEPVVARFTEVTLRPWQWRQDGGDGDLFDEATRSLYRRQEESPQETTAIEAELAAASARGERWWQRGFRRPGFYTPTSRRVATKSDLRARDGARGNPRAHDHMFPSHAIVPFSTEKRRRGRVQDVVHETSVALREWIDEALARTDDEERFRQVERDAEKRTRTVVADRATEITAATVDDDKGAGILRGGWIHAARNVCETMREGFGAARSRVAIRGYSKLSKDPFVESMRALEVPRAAPFVREDEALDLAELRERLTSGAGPWTPVITLLSTIAILVSASFYVPGYSSGSAVMLGGIGLVWVGLLLTVWRDKWRFYGVVLLGLFIPLWFTNHLAAPTSLQTWLSARALWVSGAVWLEILGFLWALRAYRRSMLRAADRHQEIVESVTERMVSEVREVYLIPHRIGARRICDGVVAEAERIERRLGTYEEIVDEHRAAASVEVDAPLPSLERTAIADSLSDPRYNETLRRGLREEDDRSIRARAEELLTGTDHWLGEVPSAALERVGGNLLNDSSTGIRARLETIRRDARDHRKELLPRSLERILDDNNRHKLLPHLDPVERPAAGVAGNFIALIWGPAAVTDEDRVEAGPAAFETVEGSARRPNLVLSRFDLSVNLAGIVTSLRAHGDGDDPGDDV